MANDTTTISSEPVTTGPVRVGRSEAKAQRREALLAAAAHHFAERGFNGVSIEDLGTAVGMSGPAVYRHFESKQALLAAIGYIGRRADPAPPTEAIVIASSD